MLRVLQRLYHVCHIDGLMLRAGKAGASQKTKEKVKGDKEAGLREGKLSLSSKVAAKVKQAGKADSVAAGEIFFSSHQPCVPWERYWSVTCWRSWTEM